METATISLEKYDNMSKAISKETIALAQKCKKYEESYAALGTQYNLLVKQMRNLTNVLHETSQIKVELLDSGEVKLVTNYLR